MNARLMMACLNRIVYCEEFSVKYHITDCIDFLTTGMRFQLNLRLSVLIERFS